MIVSKPWYYDSPCVKWSNCAYAVCNSIYLHLRLLINRNSYLSLLNDRIWNLYVLLNWVGQRMHLDLHLGLKYRVGRYRRVVVLEEPTLIDIIIIKTQHLTIDNNTPPR